MVKLSVVAWVYMTSQVIIALICSITSLYSIGAKRKQSEEMKNAGCLKLLKLWIKTTWKMRNIYSAFAVHVFDFATDLLVIAQWYNAENGDNTVDHVDSRLMAWLSIGILIFYKIISTTAIYLTTKNKIRAFAQFCDLLLFEDIYNAHQRVVTEVKNTLTNVNTTTTTSHVNKTNQQAIDLGQVILSSTQTTGSTNTPRTQNEDKKPGEEKEKEKEKPANVEDKNSDEFELMRDEIDEYFAQKNQKLLLKGVNNEAIESTMRFKYIRSLEALFESTPQAVLQLVYLMRTSEFVINGDGNNDKINSTIIILISIFQSILSMTNSMLASDNAYMAREKFKDYKKRLPPSTKFLKHFLVRLSEISYRVGLLALFWTVVGGEWFAVLFGVEMVFPLFLMIVMLHNNEFEWEEFFLSLNMVIVLPPEWIMDSQGWNWPSDVTAWILMSVFCMFCGCTITAPYNCCCKDTFYVFSSVRMGISLMEWITLIIIGILIDDDVIQNKASYLFKTDHCLYFFIVCLIFHVIFTLYPYLMPDLRLPANIPIRSVYGYAFLGEQTELERLNNNAGNNINFWDTPANDVKFLREYFRGELANVFSRLGYHSDVLLSMQLNDESIDLLYNKIQHFDPEIGTRWSRSDIEDRLKEYQKIRKRIRNNQLASIFALSNQQYETLKWLESKGAKQHILSFKTQSTISGDSYKKMGFEWARTVLRESNDECQNYKF